jgi:hypothetical protein
MGRKLADVPVSISDGMWGVALIVGSSRRATAPVQF